jgi:hypothetical protein
MALGPTSFAATAIASPILRNVKIAMTGGEPGTVSPFPDRPKGMHHKTYERLKSATLNAETLAEEQLIIMLARMQRSDRRSERRSAIRPSKEFWR